MIHVAIVGFGTVGSGTAEVLTKAAPRIREKVGEDISIKYICDLRDFPDSPFRDRMIRDYHIALRDPDIKIIAEVMGGTRAAYELTREALSAGKSVVTSNKEVVALYGPELLSLAKEKGVSYLFEASVGGGIPLLSPMTACLAANEIYAVHGILNGTCNYILTQMEKYGTDFSVALRDAQQKGYAEKDPVNDIEGYDTRRKICILTAMMTGCLPSAEAVETRGITEVSITDIKAAKDHGLKIKLLGSAKKSGDGVCVTVAPVCVPSNHPLYNVTDVFNAVVAKGDATGDVMFFGKGAGMLPTASAVVADIIDAALHGGKTSYPAWRHAGDGFTVKDPAPARYLIRTTSPEIAGKLLSPGGKTAEAEDGSLSLVTLPLTPEALCCPEIIAQYKIVE